MKTDNIKALTETFEDHVQYTGQGIEFWFARDIQHLLGYAEWRNFNKVIVKAKTACEASENKVLDHFVDVNKMVQLGSNNVSKKTAQFDVLQFNLRLSAQSVSSAFHLYLSKIER